MRPAGCLDETRKRCGAAADRRWSGGDGVVGGPKAVYSSSSSTFDGLEVFGLENLAAVETLHVLDAVTAGNDLGPGVFAGGRHNTTQ